MAPAYRSPTVRTGSRACSALALLIASVAGVSLLLPNPLADVFFAGWVLVAVGLSFVGAFGAWTNRTPLVWAAAVLLTGLSIVGMWSIGLYIAPAALLLLVSALLSQLYGPRADAREADVSDPPTETEAVLRTLGGAGITVLGGWLVYVGAFTRELFGACASETLGCVIAKLHWNAVGITILGLIAICVGGWMVWKQVSVTRALASKHSG